MVDRGVVGDEPIIDWDYLLDNLTDVLDFGLGGLPPVDGLSKSPESGCSLSIEDYLLNDEPVEDSDVLAREFIPDAILECFPGTESGRNVDSPVSGSDSERNSEPRASFELVESATVEEEKDGEKPQENDADAMQIKENGAVDDDDGDVCDPDAKKRKRQLRNRDAAVRSRERKKMYVRDLEMKSKYYEAECRRLGSVLQCCLAENQALRLSLHTSQAFDASRSKQESAVLLLESLLLGSLLGFLGIIYLLILPGQLLPTLEASLLKIVDYTECKSVAPRKGGSKNVRPLLHSFMMGKRCKASRSRMKLRLFSTDTVAVSLVSY